jgi:hypothetical protein
MRAIPARVVVSGSDGCRLPPAGTNTEDTALGVDARGDFVAPLLCGEGAALRVLVGERRGARTSVREVGVQQIVRVAVAGGSAGHFLIAAERTDGEVVLLGSTNGGGTWSSPISVPTGLGSDAAAPDAFDLALVDARARLVIDIGDARVEALVEPGAAGPTIVQGGTRPRTGRLDALRADPVERVFVDVTSSDAGEDVIAVSRDGLVFTDVATLTSTARSTVAARRSFEVVVSDDRRALLVATALADGTQTTTQLGTAAASTRVSVDHFGRAFVVRPGTAGVLEVGTPVEGQRALVVGATLAIDAARFGIAALHDGVSAVVLAETSAGIVAAVPVLDVEASELVPVSSFGALAACASCDAAALGNLERVNGTSDIEDRTVGTATPPGPLLPLLALSTGAEVASAASGMFSTCAGENRLRADAGWPADARELGVGFAQGNAYAGSRATASPGCGTGVFAVESASQAQSELGFVLAAPTCIEINVGLVVPQPVLGPDVGYGVQLDWLIGRAHPVQLESADVRGRASFSTRSGLAPDEFSSSLDACVLADGRAGRLFDAGAWWIDARFSSTSRFNAQLCEVLDDRVVSAAAFVTLVHPNGLPAGSGPFYAHTTVAPSSTSSVGYMLQRSMPTELLGVMCLETADAADLEAILPRLE